MFALLDTVLFKVGEFCCVEVNSSLLSTFIFNTPLSFLQETNLLPVEVIPNIEALTNCIVSPSDLSKKIDAWFTEGVFPL